MLLGPTQMTAQGIQNSVLGLSRKPSGQSSWLTSTEQHQQAHHAIRSDRSSAGPQDRSIAGCP